MVEQRSSKPPAWVRFLLSLRITNLKVLKLRYINQETQAYASKRVSIDLQQKQLNSSRLKPWVPCSYLSTYTVNPQTRPVFSSAEQRPYWSHRGIDRGQFFVFNRVSPSFFHNAPKSLSSTYKFFWFYVNAFTQFSLSEQALDTSSTYGLPQSLSLPYYTGAWSKLRLPNLPLSQGTISRWSDMYADPITNPCTGKNLRPFYTKLLTDNRFKLHVVRAYRCAVVSNKPLNFWSAPGVSPGPTFSLFRLRSSLTAVNVYIKKNHRKYYLHYSYTPLDNVSPYKSCRIHIPKLAVSSGGHFLQSNPSVSRQPLGFTTINADFHESSVTSQLFLTDGLSGLWAGSRERISSNFECFDARLGRSSSSPIRLSVSRSLRSTSSSPTQTSLLKPSQRKLLRFPTRQQLVTRPRIRWGLERRLRRLKYLVRRTSWYKRLQRRASIKVYKKLTRVIGRVFRRSVAKSSAWRRKRKHTPATWGVKDDVVTLTPRKRAFNATHPERFPLNLHIAGLGPNSLPPLRLLTGLMANAAFYKLSRTVGQTTLSLLPLSPAGARLSKAVRRGTRPSQFNSITSSLSAKLISMENPTLFRYFIATTSLSSNTFKLSSLLQGQLCSYRFGSASTLLPLSNLWVVPYTRLTLRKRLLQSDFAPIVKAYIPVWYHVALIDVLEALSGRKVTAHFGPYLEKALTFSDQALFNNWTRRIGAFQRILGHKIFIHEGLWLIMVSVRLKDPTFLSNWIRAMMYRMSFWKYRVLFRFVKFIFSNFIASTFQHFQLKGFKLRLKGKISVGGNSRTRTLFYSVGNTSHSKMSNRVAHDLNYVQTFTGILGFKVWFFY